uniref:Transposase n=1 Tax=Edwardsiella tarda TaxID=636 RepID=A4LA79_EDWTA|nr:hypothetical protein [Edwardsiella tarda]
MLRKIIQVLIFQVITRYTERTEFGDCVLPKPVTSVLRVGSSKEPSIEQTIVGSGGFFFSGKKIHLFTVLGQVNCSSSSAHRRFQEWRDAGVFERFWQNGLLACEQLDAIDWSWLSMDGCMTKSPLAGSKKQARTQQTEGNGA